MTSDIDIYRSANELIKQHGEAADIEAAMSPVCPLYSRKPTFEGQCPLSHRFRLLYLQEQTFLVVSPKVRS